MNWHTKFDLELYKFVMSSMGIINNRAIVLLQLGPLRQLPQTILLSLLSPPLTPLLHPLSAFRISHVDRWDHLFDPQSTTEDS